MNRVKASSLLLMLCALIFLGVRSLHAEETDPCVVEADGIRAIDWSPDGESIAVGTACGVLVLDRDLDQVLEILPLEDGRLISSVAFNHDGTLIAASVPHTVIWDVSTAEVRHVFPESFSLMPIAWHPHQNLLVIGRGDLQIQVLDANSGEIPHRYTPPTGLFSEVDFPVMACWGPRGSYIRVYFEHSAFLLTYPQWEAAPIAPIALYGAVCNENMTLLASPYSGVSTDFVHYTAAEPKCIGGLSASWNPQEDREYAVNCDDQTVLIYDQNAQLVTRIEGDMADSSALAYARSIAYSPDGSRLAALGDNGYLRLWDTATYELIARVNVVELDNQELSQQ